jgi:hypothetical protein
MNLTLKEGRRNLQPIYDDIVKAYSNGNLDDMKIHSKEFIKELRGTKADKSKEFIQTVDSIKHRDKLIMFMTNLHMQDSKETSGLSKIK